MGRECCTSFAPLRTSEENDPWIWGSRRKCWIMTYVVLSDKNARSPGLEYALSESVTLRSGVHFDQTPTRDTFCSTSVPDSTNGCRPWCKLRLRQWPGAERGLYPRVFLPRQDSSDADLFRGDRGARHDQHPRAHGRAGQCPCSQSAL